MTDPTPNPRDAPHDGDNGTPRHPGGRPRRPDTDRAILDAVGSLLSEQGMSGTTFNAVAARSGVARGTLYRRWRNRSDMIGAAIRVSQNLEPALLGDDPESNLRRHAEDARAVLDEPSFRAIIPSVIEILLRGDADEVVRSSIFTRRGEMTAMFRDRAGPSGLRADIDPALPNDMLIGTLLYRLFYSGVVPSSDEAQQIVDVILDGVRRRGDAG
jgi:AcrR family transcriptional regulator